MSYDHQAAKERIKGCYVFQITPFKEGDGPDGTTIDVDDLAKHSAFLKEARADVLCPLGGTGQGGAVTHEEWKLVVKTICDVIDGELPVAPGLRAGEHEREQAEFAVEQGCEGLLLFPPKDRGVDLEKDFAWYEQFSDLPAGLIPFFSTRYSVDFMARLCSLPNMVAFKDGVEDLAWFKECYPRVKDRINWIAHGEKGSNPFYRAGSNGVTSGLANFVPELTMEMTHAVWHEDYERAAAIEQIQMPLHQLRGSGGIGRGMLKEALRMLGIGGGSATADRGPQPLREEQRQELARLLRDAREYIEGGGLQYVETTAKAAVLSA